MVIVHGNRSQRQRPPSWQIRGLLNKSYSFKFIFTKLSRIMFNSFELCLIKYILDEYVKIIINN